MRKLDIKLKKQFLVFFCSLLAVFFVLSPYSAQSKVAGEGLTISPPIFEMTLSPGQTTSQIIKINNPTESLVQVYPLAMNFQASGNESGDPTFTPASEEGSRYSLANWISFTQAKLALTSEQDHEFTFKIDVPTNAEPGGHYGVVFFATEPPKPEEDVSQVALASMIGSLILVRVPGDIVEKAQIKEFSAKKFYFKPPVNFTLRIENLGNVHFKPRGDIIIKNMWGSRAADIEINQKKGNVLPESVRKFTEIWEGTKFAFGKFTAELIVAYGDSNQTLSSKLNFYIIPWWLIIALGVFLIIIVGVAIFYIKKYRQQKRAEREKQKKVVIR